VGKEKSSLSNIAKACSLSISTVSRALRNEKGISLETKKRVMESARQLGYFRVDARIHAKTLKSKLIGLLIADIENMYFHHLTRGVEDTLAKSGYSLILCNTDEDVNKEAEYVQILLAKEVDGIIVCPAGASIPQRHEFDVKGVPIVIIDREIEDARLTDFVGANNEEASYRAVRHLTQLGHRSIAIIIAISGLTPFSERLDGYLRALEEAGIPRNDELIIRAPERTIGAAERVTTELMLSSQVQPTAIFCTNNFMTLGTLIAAKKHHIAIPQQLSVVGFDDFDWSDALNPPPTAVSQPTYTIGTTAAQLLMRRIEKGPFIPRQRIILDVQLNERDSCRAR
jgi:DNA-binding LacI/PurR family transcriptional regulator